MKLNNSLLSEKDMLFGLYRHTVFQANDVDLLENVYGLFRDDQNPGNNDTDAIYFKVHFPSQTVKYT